jgi:polyphosphate kinase
VKRHKLYVQRYLQQFPAAGEVVVFDRSWYNRAGVEYVMGFCHEDQYQAFVDNCPKFEKHIVKSGIILIKFWLEVGQEEQEQRFRARLKDPMRRWKLSSMDIESYARWYAFSRARDMMLEATDSEESPWHIVRSDDKQRARLNCISHLLTLIPYKDAPREKVELPKRSSKGRYDDQATLEGRRFVADRY